MTIFSANLASAENVSVSAKESEDHIFLIFHHPRSLTLSPSYAGSNGRVRADAAISMVRGHNDLVEKLCSSINLNKQYNNLIDFRLNDKYRFIKTIIGEKLVAFKITNPDYKGASSSDQQNDAQLQEIKASEAKMNDELKAAAKNATKDENADSVVEISSSKTGLELKFSFAQKNVGATVVKRGKDLWVVFDARKNFYMPQNSNIDSARQYVDPKNTIIKIKLSKDLYPRALKRGNNWVVALSSVPSKQVSNLAGSLKSEIKSDNLLTIETIESASNIIKVRDEDIGDVLVFVPLPKQNAFLKKARSMLDYKILQSAQGVGISLESEETQVDFSAKNKSIEVVSAYKIPSKNDQAVMHDQATTILPSLSFAVYGGDYLSTENKLVRSIANSANISDKFTDQINLARFYFVNSMFRESLGMIELVSKTDSKKASTIEIQLMKAVAMIQSKQNIDARTVFADLKTNYKNSPSITEINMWDRYNEHVIRGYAETIGALDNEYLLQQYDDLFYWQLILAELEVATSKKDFKLIDKILSNLRKSDDLHIINNLKFYKSEYYYLQNQNNLAEALLKEIQSNPATENRDLMMAELQLIKIMYEEGKIDWISAVQKLQSLRFAWRGDSLELKTLTSLALAYNQNGDVINAIRTYKYIVDAFGKDTNNAFFVTSQIVQLYNSIFLSDKMRELDDFEVIALFYEFKDYTPIGTEGDRAVLGIARRMLNLDLLDMAIDILQHQVTYRLRGKERIITANHLALVYLMDKKPKDALRVLEETDKENTDYDGYKQRIELKAKALIDLGKYSEAMDYLKDDPSEDARILRTEAFFKNNKWGDYIAASEKEIKEKIAAGDVIKGNDAQDVLRLAISYSMLNKISDLAYISSHLVTEDVNLKNVVEFLKDTNKPINPHSLDKSLNIDRMQGFIDSSKDMLFN